MNKKNLAIVIVTLFIGGIIGFFTAGRLAKHRIDKLRNMANDPQTEKSHLADRLDLSADQREKVANILDTRIPEQRQIMRAHRSEMDSLRQLMFDEIKPFLNADQISKMEAMKKRRNHKRRRHSPPH